MAAVVKNQLKPETSPQWYFGTQEQMLAWYLSAESMGCVPTSVLRRNLLPDHTWESGRSEQTSRAGPWDTYQMQQSSPKA